MGEGRQETQAIASGAVAWGLRDVLVAVALLAGGAAALLGAARLLPPGTPLLLFPLIIAEELLILGLALYFGHARSRAPWQALGFRPLRSSLHMVMTVMTPAASLLATGLYVLVIGHLGLRSLLPPSVAPVFRGLGPVLGPLAASSAVLLAPLAEELFFRGFLLQGLLRPLGTWGAVGVSSLVFGISHGALGMVIPAALAGMLLGALFLRTRSIWAPIGAHALQNAIVLSLGQ
ncbi:MAG: CPBP family intramembrane metalloprotease [Chloroflexi bacterium]|nr:CPBP family intramembrane metalloprotease [Chloroflexota bacterium]